MKIVKLITMAFVIMAICLALASCLECSHSSTREEVIVPATCSESGLAREVCSSCGEFLREYQIPGGHVGDTPVQENKVIATCTTDGHHDLVVYCYRCNFELSRNYVFVPAGHTLTPAVEENKIPATCTEDGSYDSVVYCYMCKEEISRDHKIIVAGHKNRPAIEENKVEATCTEDGSYDSVIYCSVCNEEVSRVHETIVSPGHTEVMVEENKIEATCTANGNYDIVIYCSVCNTEISRDTKVISAPGHTEVVDEAENATCGKSGLTEGRHCSVCGEIFVAQEVIPQLITHGETYTAVENEVPASDYTEGKCDIVVYCSVCNKEFSRNTITTPPLSESNPDTIPE